MGNTKLPPLMEYFANIEDPRRETKNKKYPLIEVIAIAFLAVMSGADGWESIGLHEQFPKWKSINSIGVVVSTRDAGGKAKTEWRYMVSSLGVDEEQFAHAVRANWGIENRLHYIFDVIYREDACRVRKDYSPLTLTLVRKIALTITRSDKESNPASGTASNKWLGQRIIWKACCSVWISLRCKKLHSTLTLHL